MITVLVALLAGSLGVLMASIVAVSGADRVQRDAHRQYQRHIQEHGRHEYARGYEAGLRKGAVDKQHLRVFDGGA